MVSVLPEVEQNTFLRISAAGYHTGLALGLRHAADPAMAARSAAWLINGKALELQVAAEAVLLGRGVNGSRTTPEPNASLTQKLRDTRLELARLILAPATPDQETARQKQRRQLFDRQRDLVKQLATGQFALEEDPWIELAEVRKRLPDHTVFIDLARFEVRDFTAMSGQPKLLPAHYAAWITPVRGNVQVIDLGPAEAIDTAVHKARLALRAAAAGLREKAKPRDDSALRQPLDDLARLVLHPLLPHIDKAERWIICPDGNLFLVPWAALSLANGHPAIEGHAISCVTSGRDLVAVKSPAQVSAPLVLANPDVEQQDKLMAALLPAVRRYAGADPSPPTPLPQGERGEKAPSPPTPLPQGERGGKAPSPPTALPQGERGEKVPGEAMAAAFQAAHGPRVVVLTAPGYFLADQQIDPRERVRLAGMEQPRQVLNLENPLLRFGLVLAGTSAKPARDGQDAGLLMGSQIVAGDLRGTELVVLPVTETGPGEAPSGEAVAGLRQAFQFAGAGTLLAALWPAPEGAEVLTGFLDNLSRGQRMADALRNAQLSAIKSGTSANCATNVLSWTGFTLTGMAAVAPALTAADLEPLGSSEACNERGLKWLKQGRSNLAVADFEAALKLDPKFARAYHNLSMVYRERDELDRALEYADKAVALDPNAAHCRHRALLFRLRADYVKSLADLDKAVAADDKDVNILLERAFVQRTLGHLEEAAADCDRP